MRLGLLLGPDAVAGGAVEGAVGDAFVRSVGAGEAGVDALPVLGGVALRGGGVGAELLHHQDVVLQGKTFGICLVADTGEVRGFVGEDVHGCDVVDGGRVGVGGVFFDAFAGGGGEERATGGVAVGVKEHMPGESFAGEHVSGETFAAKLCTSVS